MDNTELIRALRSAAATTGLDAYVELMQKAADALNSCQSDAGTHTAPAEPANRPMNCGTGFCSCIECDAPSMEYKPMAPPQINLMLDNMGIYDGDYETAIVRAVEKHYEIKGATQ